MADAPRTVARRFKCAGRQVDALRRHRLGCSRQKRSCLIDQHVELGSAVEQRTPPTWYPRGAMRMTRKEACGHRHDAAWSQGETLAVAR